MKRKHYYIPNWRLDFILRFPNETIVPINLVHFFLYNRIEGGLDEFIQQINLFRLKDL